MYKFDNKNDIIENLIKKNYKILKVLQKYYN